MNKLNDKNILITGASQGLGRELAIAFAKNGAAGLSLAARHLDTLRDVRDEVRQISSATKVLTIEADVSKAKDIERLVATTLDAFGGRLDVLINNASTIGPSPMPFLLDYPLEDFQNVLDTNLIGPFLLIKNLLPAMIENGGSIINVTSDAGANGYPGWGRVRDIKIRTRRYVANMGVGTGRDRRAGELGRSRKYEHRDAPRCRAGRRSRRMGRSRYRCRRFRFPRLR